MLWLQVQFSSELKNDAQLEWTWQAFGGWRIRVYAIIKYKRLKNNLRYKCNTQNNSHKLGKSVIHLKTFRMLHSNVTEIQTKEPNLVYTP